MKTTDDKRATNFVAALATLSTEHGVGITGTPVLFMMEHDDFERSYHINDASELVFE